MGDYNNVLSINERIRGKIVHEGEYIDLSNMLVKCGLFKMDRKGDRYTWCNKHINGTIYSCIDRVVANRDWF